MRTVATIKNTDSLPSNLLPLPHKRFASGRGTRESHTRHDPESAINRPVGLTLVLDLLGFRGFGGIGGIGGIGSRIDRRNRQLQPLREVDLFGES